MMLVNDFIALADIKTICILEPTGIDWSDTPYCDLYCGAPKNVPLEVRVRPISKISNFGFTDCTLYVV